MTMVKNNFLNAKIARFYVLSESTECIQPASLPPTAGALQEAGTVYIMWTRDQGEDVLTVTSEMQCVLFVDSVAYLQYECKSETRFNVNSHGGFDPKEALPADATAPYVDMALWLARQHTANAIREAGVPSFYFRDAIGAKEIAESKVGEEIALSEEVTKTTKGTVGRSRKISKPRAKGVLKK